MKLPDCPFCKTKYAFISAFWVDCCYYDCKYYSKKHQEWVLDELDKEYEARKSEPSTEVYEEPTNEEYSD